jgi:4-amino-4-deoxy-L-arabinose transferase-like glycosyltransferase
MTLFSLKNDEIRYHCIFALVLVLLSVFFVWGLQFIPFHPDESTYLYMSSDFDVLLSDPLSLAWHTNQENDPRQRYRELDAPLHRYILGVGRTLAGLPALPVDWDWSSSWEDNIASGAYDDQLLSIGRLSVTILLPLSLFFIYQIGKSVHGYKLGLIVVLLLCSNALVLLHARRAMAEGVLLFGVTLALWGFLQGRGRSWLAGLGMAIAFSAKQSTLPLLPVGLVAVCWLDKHQDSAFRKIASNITQFVAAFVFVTSLLNPLYWRDPINALHASYETRQDLLASQIADTQYFLPDKLLETPTERTIVMGFNIFVSPPIYGLFGNLEPTWDEIARYLRIPGHNLFRGFIWGGIFLTLMLCGIFFALQEIMNKSSLKRKSLAILLLATLAQAGALIAVVPLPWPRYSIPLIPLTTIWIAYGMVKISQALRNRFPDKLHLE